MTRMCRGVMLVKLVLGVGDIVCQAKSNLTAECAGARRVVKSNTPIEWGVCFPCRSLRSRRLNQLQPKLGIQPVQHSWERNGLAHVLEPADPRYGPFDPHAEAAVRDTPKLSQIQIPLECL